MAKNPFSLQYFQMSSDKSRSCVVVWSSIIRTKLGPHSLIVKQLREGEESAMTLLLLLLR